MKRRYHLHAPFWAYVGLAVVVGSAAHTQSNNLLYWIFGVMLGGLLLSGLISGLMMMSVQAARVCPSHGVVGEPLIIRYAVTNRSRFMPVFNLHVEERAANHRGPGGRPSWRDLMPPAGAWIMHANPRDTVHGEAVFWPARRGEARFDELRLWTTFPFGIIRKSITVSRPQHTLIHPAVHGLRPEALQAAAPREALGLRVSLQPGHGEDYLGLRDYRAGDQLRQIAWKRATSLDRLISIERSQAGPSDLRVVLNLTIPTDELRLDAGDDCSARELEERAISLAASVLAAADRAGYAVGLSIAGVVQPAMPVRRNQWHLTKLMAALASIDLDSPRSRREKGAAGSGSSPRERARIIVVHPDRVDPSIGRDAWHLTARQMTSLLAPSSPAAGVGAAVRPPVPALPLKPSEAAA